jgi:hypothetical protein
MGVLAALSWLTALPLTAAPPDDSADAPRGTMPDSLRAFSEPIPGVNWDEMQPELVRDMERIFERSGWTQESDRFALEVARRVAARPPWDIAGRITAFTDSMTGRYGLSPDQANRFQASFLHESTGFLLRHGPALFAQGHEALQARANGIPYTADQVARWSKDAEPLFRDIAQSVDRLSTELEAGLDDDKKEILKKDLARYNERQQVVERMSASWAKGEWDAAQWGMDNDPIQMGRTKARTPDETAESPAVGATPRPAAPPPLPPQVREFVIPSRWIDHDPATWIAIVLEVRDRYQFDAGQMSTAWSVHGELVERAAAYAKTRGDELSGVPVAERSRHEAFRPIRELFDELRDRLEAIPTSSQRDSARR